MADYHEHLSTLETDPHNAQALSALVRLAAATGDKGGLAQPNAAHALDEARKAFRERGEMELVARLYDVELAVTTDRDRRAALILEKGRLLYEELFDENEAIECLQRVLELRPEDPGAQELLAHIDLVRANWEKIVKKYLEEARVSTDRQLSTRLYLSVAESYARNQSDAPEVETYLRKALEVEPRNRLANAHLERLLLEGRVEGATTKEERVQGLLALAEVARARLNQPDVAVEAMKKILAVEPGHPRALAVLIDAYTAAENWSALVKVYEGALKARQKSPQAQDELGLYLQIAMIYWKRLGQMDAAEEYFRRIRKLDPSHVAMVDFYRAYHRDRGEGQKLLAVLQQALKGDKDADRKKDLATEVAGLAEGEGGNPEKAIDSWKAILRQDPRNPEARGSLKRLYQKTEKWNALLELLKEEVEQIPADQRDARVERLMEVVAIYRDRLNLDVMVINTYNSILAQKPDYVPALDALAQKYEQLARWNDLITVLQRKADAPAVDRMVRAALLRRIAGLWTDRFGNQAQAVKPLEELLALEPGDATALAKLKEIYTKRRQWPCSTSWRESCRRWPPTCAGRSWPRWRGWRRTSSATCAPRSRSGIACSSSTRATRKVWSRWPASTRKRNATRRWSRSSTASARPRPIPACRWRCWRSSAPSTPIGCRRRPRPPTPCPKCSRSSRGTPRRSASCATSTPRPATSTRSRSSTCRSGPGTISSRSCTGSSIAPPSRPRSS